MLNDAVVKAKQEYARAMAGLNGMRYEMVAGSDALQGVMGIG